MSDWQTVPKIADDAMLRAAARSLDQWRENEPGDPQRKADYLEKHAIRYRAMLAAAPPPPAVRVTPQMIEAGMKADLHVGRDEVEAILRAAFAVSFPIQQDA